MSQVGFKLLENPLLFCTWNVLILFTMVVDLITVDTFVSASVSVKAASKTLWRYNESQLLEQSGASYS